MLRTHAAGRRRAAQFHTMQSSSPYSLDRASALHAPGTSISVTSAKALEAALHSEAQQRDNHRTSRASSSRNPVGFPVASTSFYSDTSSSASSHNDHHDVSSPPSAIASSVTSPPLSPARTNGDTDSVGSAEGQRDAVNNRLASEIWDGELTSGGDPQVRLTRRKSAPRQQPEAMPSNKRRGGKIQKANPNYEADEPIAKRRRLRVSLAAREHAAHQSASSPGSALAARARRASEPVACVPGMETPAKKKYVRRNVGGDCVAMGRQGPIAASKENEVDNSEDEGEAESSMTASVRPAKASKPSWKRKVSGMLELELLRWLK